jgi:hypothetical protein
MFNAMNVLRMLLWSTCSSDIFVNSNITFLFRFVSKRAICRLGIILLALAPVHVNDFPVVNVHVDELSSAQIWQHKLRATLSPNVNINYRLPIKENYRICTLRHIRIEIIHGSKNMFWVLTWVGGYHSKLYPSPLARDNILISTNPC